MTRMIAYNATERRWQVVGSEDEIQGEWNVVTQYWSTTLKTWVTVPEDE